ncbi:NADH dehydrogenase [ubiquinone] 1 beta subcomplex subunit 6 [Stegostoma tigrinum]|uniref:NADH dehydrogenase [ubiquinone] 1 beta subcomplex subunit 6 n=1 Tax=Stegostoma tigrinum TaxID=3053191 RepID=UPI00202B899F|nr:NADH dehydrogenase [ubiquinone] 1 beta subcomplex subunit 6 [Stegostoma tigrinum]
MPLGYTPDEKARFLQLVKLRRQWLKDQELSPREPVLPSDSRGPVARFWDGFLQPRSLWRVYTYKTCSAGWWTLTRLLIPAWITHYYVKYHVATKPYGIVSVKPRIFPGDTVLETGEVIPPMQEDAQNGHH